MPSSSVVATVHLRARISSDQSGLTSSTNYMRRVCHFPDPCQNHRLNSGVDLITDAQLEAHAHLKLVGLVGSIDNDMALTDLTIGAPTALQRICESIDNINSTAYSHSRAFVVEVMGRDCGWLALMAGIACVSFLSSRVRQH